MGSALLGGGVVASAYELARPGSVGFVGSRWGAPGGDEDGGDGFDSRGDSSEGTAGGATDGDPAAAGDPLLPLFRQPDPTGTYAAFPPVFAPLVPFDAAAKEEYAKHAVITSLAVVVRERADRESPMAGIVRSGTRLRVKAEPAFGGGCGKGWYAVFPKGWLCRDAGLAVGDEPPEDGIVRIPAPELAASLPYEYWRVKDLMTPFFHRLPSYTEQDRADGAGRIWYGKQGTKPMPTHPAERPDEVPAVVKEYMNAGYYITKAGEEEKLKRRFVRTLRGTYVRKYQLHQRPPPKFQGQLVTGSQPLPVYFIRREIPYETRESETSDVLVKSDDIPKRLSLATFERRFHLGNKQYYEDADGRLMRAYAVSKAAKIKRPTGLAGNEKWIHVDLSEQTLVAYDGDRPVFVTLVSTGKEPGMTPTGVFRVQTKHIATSMRDQPSEEEAYSIEDVPWTQYFHANVALHGAFWHAGFGLVRSHGCVNLSPADARWLFGYTDPPVPDGWHSVTSETLSGPEGTAIVVTD